MRVICVAVLGVPYLTLRDNTERPVTITEGTGRLVSREPDRIVRTSREALLFGASPGQRFQQRQVLEPCSMEDDDVGPGTLLLPGLPALSASTWKPVLDPSPTPKENAQ